jgi:hypothetical protein
VDELIVSYPHTMNIQNTTTATGIPAVDKYYATGETDVKTIDQLSRGEYFKFSDKPSAKVWRLAAYDRSARAYWADDCSDISNGKLVKSDRYVFVGFDY